MRLLVRNLVKVFTEDGGLSVRALDGLTVDVPGGSLTVIMGPNGSGKSTLFRILGGQLSPDTGEVLINNTPLYSGRQRAAEQRIAHVPQEPKTLAFPEMTLEEHLLWSERAGRSARFWARGVTATRRAKYRSLLEQYQLDTLAAALQRPLKTLSVGWQQIFIVFMAANGRNLTGDYVNTPEILLLDEPTSALDVENAKLCLDLVRALHHEGRTVIIATHDGETAVKMAERLCVLRKGRIAADISRGEISHLGIAGVLSLASGIGPQSNYFTPSSAVDTCSGEGQQQ